MSACPPLRTIIDRLVRRLLAPALLLCWQQLAPVQALDGFLEIRDGYFWDPGTSNYFIPRGIAYQVWNPPVGADQSFPQLDYDLLEFTKIHANSVRCEMVWGELEIADGVYDWTKADHLVAQAEKLGLKLFVLIGFQYPPAWFPLEWRGINSEGLTPAIMGQLAQSPPGQAFAAFPPRTAAMLDEITPPELKPAVSQAMIEGAKAGSVSNVLQLIQTRIPPLNAADLSRLLISDVINYENPDARAAYSRHLAAVAARYKDSTAIGGWIMGNEYAYFDLWEDPNLYAVHRFIGYDRISQESFRAFLRDRYQTNIAALNANWQTAYPDFDSVVMPPEYPPDRVNPGYFDLIQWRKKSIGDFVATGAAAARQVDSHHLQTYSMVGGVFSGRDANNTCEDARTIVARCRAAGAPLDFWSLNNYANAAIGSELRSADFGIAKYQEESGLPVMISETGHSSTETLFDYPDAGKRQPKALPGQIWESLVSGAIGTHIFHWNDRNQYTEKFFLRERGFGIVQQDRLPKGEVYDNVLDMFRRMEELRLDSFLGGSLNPPPDVQFFWSTNADMVWPRANQENAMLWGSLKRVGFQPGIISDSAFEKGAWSNAPALLLSRSYQMAPAHLRAINDLVLPAGIHVHADADLPGQYDPYHRLNPEWTALMNSIFGVDASHAFRGFHGIVTNDNSAPLHLRGVAALAPLSPDYDARINSWEIWHGVALASGIQIVRHNGAFDSQPDTPALILRSVAGRGRAALNTFALGDISADGGPKELGWDLRFDWLQAIYQSFFKVTPKIQLTGEKSKYVIPDYRLLRDGGILISLLNEGTNDAHVTVTAPELALGKTVENLTTGRILELNSDGVFDLALTGDDYHLLYVHDRQIDGTGAALQFPLARIRFASAPVIVHPRTESYPVRLDFDTLGATLQASLSFELSTGTIISSNGPVIVQGQGQKDLGFVVPSSQAPDSLSTADGARYFLSAALWDGPRLVAKIRVPIRLAFAPRPVAELPDPIPGRAYTIPIVWEELPALDLNDPTPFDRAKLFDAFDPSHNAYVILLSVLDSAGNSVASSRVITRSGSGAAALTVSIPTSAAGPFSWSLDARPVLSVRSNDIFEGFESGERGARWPDALTTDFLAPWQSFQYSFPSIPGLDLWQNEGVQLGGSEGSQSAFLVMTNPPSIEVGSFGLERSFPVHWALPADPSLWTNWVFSFDFKELHGYGANLEMQIKNDAPGTWIQKSFPYVPGSNGWATVRASLAEFAPPPDAPEGFDSTAVASVALNVLMRTPGVQYVAFFDNISFDGPDTPLSLGSPVSHFLSAGDLTGSIDLSRAGGFQLRLSWSGLGSLQWAENPGGPWTSLPSVTSPQMITATNSVRFFRLQR